MKVNTPKRRFKGFSENWEQRKLGEHLEKVRSYPISRSQETQNITNTKYIHYGDIHVNIAEYINQNTKLPYIIENEKYESLKIGDLIFADASEDKDGIAKASFISKNKYDFNIVGGTHTIATRPNQSIVQSEFIYFFSKTNRFRKYAMKMATGTKIYGITYSNLAKMAIASPLNTEEQKKIIKMISNIEVLVTLHKRKFEKLKQLQKSYLSESILSEPKCVPKRRFKGFTDDWEQEKLKNVVITNPYEELPEKFNYVNLESVLGTSLISYECTNIENAPSRAQRLAKKGDIFFQNVRPYQKNNLLFNLDCSNYVFSTGYTQLRPKLNSGFLFSIIQKDKFVNKVLNRCTGSSYPAISSKDLIDIKVNISRNIEEQNKIADFIGTIDKLLTLHKNKRDTIQKLQKIYLQNNLEDETYA